MWVLVSVAWRNLWRHGRRTAITAVAMGVGVALAWGLAAFSDGSGTMMFRVLVDESLGHVQVHHPDYPAKRQMYDTIRDASARLEAIEAVDGVRATSVRLTAMGLLGGDEEVEGGQLVGVDPRRERQFATLEDDLRTGRYLADEAAQEVVIGSGLADKLQIGVGDALLVVTQAADGSIGNGLFEVVGTITSGSAMVDKSGAFAHIDDVRALLALGDEANEILIVGPGREDVQQLFDGVKAAIGVPVIDALPEKTDAPPEGTLLVRRWMDASPQAFAMLTSYDGLAVINIVIVLALASLSVLNTMLMAVFERTYELGVLKSLGMRPRQIVGMVLAESALLGVVSTAAGLVLGGLLVWYLIAYGVDFSGSVESFESMGVTFDAVMYGEFRWSRLLVTVFTVLVVSVVAALWPAFRAARLRPVEAMREDS